MFRKAYSVLNGILCFIFGFFVTNYFLEGMTSPWKLIVALTSLFIFVLILVVRVITGRRHYDN